MRFPRRSPFRPALAAALLATVLSACSGGGNAGRSPMPGIPSSPVTATPTVAASSQPVSVQIHVPAASAGASATARTPAFVSSGTQSVTIGVYTSNPGTTPPAAVPAASTVTVNLDGTTCTYDSGTSGARTCTAQVPAPVTTGAGADYFVFHTYTAADAGGTLLGAAIAANPVIAGQANTVRVALGGVVASLALTPAVESGDGALNASYVIGISAYDASGDLIVAGANDPFATPLSLAAPAVTTDGTTSPAVTTTIVDGTGTVASPSTLRHSSDSIRVAYAAAPGSRLFQYTVNVAAPAYAGLAKIRNPQVRSNQASIPAASTAQAAFTPIFITTSSTGAPAGTAQPVFSQNGGGTDPTLTFTSPGQVATITSFEGATQTNSLNVTPGASCGGAISMTQGLSGAYTFSASSVATTTTCAIVVSDGNGGSATLNVTNVKNAATKYTAAQTNAALSDAEAYFQTLPHTDIVADIKSVAAHMVSSGNFSAAVPGPGGITATLPDGEPALVFADSPESLGLDPQGVARSRAAQSVRRPDRAISGPTNHEILFLGNNTDTDTFHSQIDGDFSSAFSARFGAAYGVDAQPITLDSIVTLGFQHPIDFLNVSTHGMITGAVASGILQEPYKFTLLSTTNITDAYNLEFESDLASGTLQPAEVLSTSTLPPAYAFTPAFLTEYLTFNSGAIVDLGACWSGNDLTQADTNAAFAPAHIARYYGWTKSTVNRDYYESQGFLFDRLLGEQSPPLANMASYATQRVPPQRPFALDNVYAAMQSETRSSPYQSPQPEPYTYSDVPKVQTVNPGNPPEDGDGYLARFVPFDTSYNATTQPTVRALPSISNMYVIESPASGALNILGRFPAAQGSVTIAGLGGTPVSLPIVNWATSHIIATLPNGGDAGSGIVTVMDADGVPSNGVPLTTWSGTLNYRETDRISSLGGVGGSGTGTVGLNLNVDLRADVHPVVPDIDTTPMPQNFAISNVEGGSTGTLTVFGGQFISNDDTKSAGFAGPSPNPTVQGGSGTASGTFGLLPVSSQPSPCDDNSFGPEANAGLVFCPALAFNVPVALSCFDTTGGSLCSTPQTGPVGSGAYGTSSGEGGLLQLTLDPATFGISVSATSVGFTSGEFFGNHPAQALVSGSFGSPLYPPSATATAATKARKN